MVLFQQDVNMKNDLKLIIADEDVKYYFRVIGNDRKIHVSDLCTNKCKCCEDILRKYVTEKDYLDGLYSCYECTF
jgi:hypothetical protein